MNKGTAETSTLDGSSGLVNPEKLRVFGHYELVRLVGRGGMGNVFYARDQKLDREVAIKIPRLDLLYFEGIEERFLREAQAAARLNHPNLVSILQVGTEGDIPYIVTQWCDRGDLSAWMRGSEKAPPIDVVASIMADVADAIQHCHDCGVVHLDLKPSNILLMSSSDHVGQEASLANLIPKVTDFGLARLLESQLEQSSTSMFLGTPLYMAPEQAECQRELIGPTSDIFSLGLVLYELASGENRYSEDTLATVMDRIRRADRSLTPTLDDLPRDMQTIVSRCLQRDPEDRYSSANMLAEDLRRFASSQPINARPVALSRRFWLWCGRPERITQAGATTVAIQVSVLANFASYFLFLGLGFQLPYDFDKADFFREVSAVALFPHVPLLWNGIRTIQHRRWSVIIGLLLTLFFVGGLMNVLISGKPAFSIYEGRPMATLTVHLFILSLAVVQLVLHLFALPATRQTDR